MFKVPEWEEGTENSTYNNANNIKVNYFFYVYLLCTKR